MARENWAGLVVVVLSALITACAEPADETAAADSRSPHAQRTDAMVNHFWEFNGRNNQGGLASPQGAAATACRLWKIARNAGDDVGGTCTCVLVARNVVATAAHCTHGWPATHFAVQFQRRASDPWPGIELAGTFEVDGVEHKWVGDEEGKSFLSVRKFERPGYEMDTAEGDDIALVVLEKHVPAAVVYRPAVVNTVGVNVVVASLSKRLPLPRLAAA